MASVSPLLRRLTLPSSIALQTKHLELPALHRRISSPFPFQLRRAIPICLAPLAATAFSNLQSFLSSLWESILLAVPKQKTSYSKKRSRQLAGKALKDVTSLNHCSSCGRVKRAHILCPYCVALVKSLWSPKSEGGIKTYSDATTKRLKKLAEGKKLEKKEPTATSQTKSNANPVIFPERPGQSSQKR